MLLVVCNSVKFFQFCQGATIVPGRCEGVICVSGDLGVESNGQCVSAKVSSGVMSELRAKCTKY